MPTKYLGFLFVIPVSKVEILVIQINRKELEIKYRVNAKLIGVKI